MKKLSKEEAAAISDEELEARGQELEDEVWKRRKAAFEGFDRCPICGDEPEALGKTEVLWPIDDDDPFRVMHWFCHGCHRFIYISIFGD